GGTVQRNTIIEYSSTTNDTIDFTGDVKLKITSENEGRSVTYTVKVNVHQLEPDTLYWDQAQRRDVPGATSNSKAQRTVDFNGKYYCIAQNGNAFNLSTSATINAGWTTQAVTLPFEPVVTSFTATTTAMYILSKQGDLYTSPDATNWTETGHSMAHILGAYDDRIIGLSLDGSTYMHDEYPAPDGFTSSPVDDQFPVYGNSPMVQASNTWGLSHQAMIAGGVNANGQPLNIVWGYDGNVWGMVSNTAAGALPELVEPVLMAYKTTELDTVTLKASVRDTWLVMGGKKADGTINSETFASYDQGVKWSKATTSMQLPQYITPFYGAQAFIVTETLSLPKAKAFRVKTNNNQWDCPFIYIIGGYAHNGTFLNNIWKGVINRLAFKPVY
ncbi:MAG: hypothetical protein IK092_00305, partial [Muribaculaceae bacterium]|nr:hypothetical protein [Muribaculaceae bacterium]